MEQLTNKIILGTVQLGLPYGINNAKGVPSDAETERLLDTAYEHGIRSLDTADAYGRAIEVIGNYHRSRPGNRFRVNNKFSGTTSGKASLVEKVKAQLHSLQVPYFDHYILHRAQDLDNPEVMEMMMALKEDGLTRKIGVSVYGNDQLKQAIDAPLVESIQLPYNLLDNQAKRGNLLKEAKQKNKEIHVRSVFLQGLFFMKEENIPAKLRPLSGYLQKIRRIADESNIPVAQLAMQYVLQNELIDKVLIGADDTAQLLANMQAIHSETDPAVLALAGEIDVAEEALLNPVNW